MTSTYLDIMGRVGSFLEKLSHNPAEIVSTM